MNISFNSEKVIASFCGAASDLHTIDERLSALWIFFQNNLTDNTEFQPFTPIQNGSAKETIIEFINATPCDFSVQDEERQLLGSVNRINLILISDFFSRQCIFNMQSSQPLICLPINQKTWTIIHSYLTKLEIPEIPLQSFNELLEIYIELQPYAEPYDDPLNILYKKIEQELCLLFFEFEHYLDDLNTLFDDPRTQNLANRIFENGVEELRLFKNQLTYTGTLNYGFYDLDILCTLDKLHKGLNEQVSALKIKNTYIPAASNFQERFPNLKSIELIECKFEDDVFSVPPSIERLSLKDCALDYIAKSEDEQVSNLQFVSLSDIDGLTTLPRCLINENTKEVFVTNCPDIEDISSLANGCGIKKISLSGCHNIAHSSYSLLAGLRYIEDLDISNTSFNLTSNFNLIHEMIHLKNLNIINLKKSWIQSDYEKLSSVNIVQELSARTL